MADQGAAAPPAGRWPVYYSDGTGAASFPISFPADLITTGTITSSAGPTSKVSIPLSGYPAFSAAVSGVFSGTMVLEISFDGGTTYRIAQCYSIVSSGPVTSFTAADEITPTVAAGATHAQVRATAWTSGTANIRFNQTQIAQYGVSASETQSATPNFKTVLAAVFNLATSIVLPVYMANGAPVSSDNGWVVRQVPEFSSRSDTYTAAANGTTVNVSTHTRQYFAIQVKGTGAAATAWEVVLEAGLDGSNFSTVLTHKNTTQADGEVIWLSVRAPALYFRSRCVSITLGGATNVIATILGRY